MLQKRDFVNVWVLRTAAQAGASIDTVQRTGDWNPTGSRPWLQFFWSGIFFAPLDCSKHAKNSAIDRGRTFRVVKKNLDKKYVFILVKCFPKKCFFFWHFFEKLEHFRNFYKGNPVIDF